MTEESYIKIIVALIGALALLLVAFFRKQKKDCKYTSKDHEMIVKLLDIHNVKDADGKPLVYVSHNLEENQKEILKQLLQFMSGMHRLTDLLKQTLRRD